MAKNKIERIDQEIAKVREKIAEYQEMTSNIRRSSCLINPVCSPMGGLSVIICRRAFIAMTCAVLTTTPESRSV